MQEILIEWIMRRDPGREHCEHRRRQKDQPADPDSGLACELAQGRAQVRRRVNAGTG